MVGETHTLLTPRLHLQPCGEEDLETLHGLWIDPEVRRYLWDGQIIDRATAAAVIRDSMEQFRRGGLGLWLVRRRDGLAIGFCGFRGDAVPELLFGLAPSHWGQGYATEAARAVLCLALQQRPWPRIRAGSDAPNIASQRVLERLGMRPLYRELGAFGEVIWYELCRNDFVE